MANYNEFLSGVFRYKGVPSLDWGTLSRTIEQPEDEDPTKVVSLDLCGNEAS